VTENENTKLLTGRYKSEVSCVLSRNWHRH